ncbi:MAG TPA: hypothetical protein VGV67_08855 [Solirubrobacteraceae bacterium]|nr:hypothetical protein [Solirubrobacteraceae bacterium]
MTASAGSFVAAAALTLGSAEPAIAGKPPRCISWKNDSNPPGSRTITVTSRCARPVRIKIVVPWGFDSRCFWFKPRTTRTFPVYSARPLSGSARVETC